MFIIPSESKLFFTGCIHLNHSNIIKYSNRPFLCKKDQAELDRRGSWNTEFYTDAFGKVTHKFEQKYKISQESTDMMNKTIIDNINETVGVDDYLILLGDNSYIYKGDKKGELVVGELLKQIKCNNIYTIRGNHDSQSILRMFVGNYLGDIAEIKYGDDFIYCNHYCNAVWNHSHRGSYHVYSHSHSQLEPIMNEKFPMRKSLDAGIDNAYKITGEYRPLEWEEIKSYIDERINKCKNMS